MPRIQHVIKRIRGKEYVQHIITVDKQLVKELGWDRRILDLHWERVGRSLLLGPTTTAAPRKEEGGADSLPLFLTPDLRLTDTNETP